MANFRFRFRFIFIILMPAFCLSACSFSNPFEQGGVSEVEADKSGDDIAYYDGPIGVKYVDFAETEAETAGMVNEDGTAFGVNSTGGSPGMAGAANIPDAAGIAGAVGAEGTAFAAGSMGMGNAGIAGNMVNEGNASYLAASGGQYVPQYPEEGIVMSSVRGRIQMDNEAEVVATLMEGERVIISGEADKWYFIGQITQDAQGMQDTQNAQQSCYVNKKYVIPVNYINSNSTSTCKAPSIVSLDPDRPMVALTFDDGPKAEVTNRILNCLENVGGHATFFMMGGRVVGENNDCVIRMLSLGCELGNHTYNHEAFNTIPSSKIRPDVRMADYMIEETCGQAPSLLRPPGGAVEGEAQAELRGLGVPVILWSIDTRDWETQDSDETYQSIMNNVQDGDIVLMHDTYSQTAEAIERVIPELVSRGFQLVTVSELAASRGITLEAGEVYRKFRRN